MLTIQRVVGVVKVTLAEWIAMFCLAAVVADQLVARGVHGCPPEPRHLGWVVLAALPLGLVLYGWALHRILAARVAREVHQPTLQAGPLIVANPKLGPQAYPFATTHPSYLLLDLLALGGAYVMYLVAPDDAGCGMAWEWARGRAALAVALSFPLLRVLGWYVLRRRPPEPAAVGAWKPVALFLAILGTPLLLASGVLLDFYKARRRAPVVDAERFAGGLAAHPEVLDQIVKVRGKSRSEAAARCRCTGAGETGCAQTEVLLDLGPGGEALVQVNGLDGHDWASEARGALGKTLSTYGRVHRLPDSKAPAPCRDYGAPPPAGRILVVGELPH